MEIANSLSAARDRSFFAALWQRWRRKRQRDRMRALSHVRFRLTREGVHFVGLLMFIFLGAVIRDINLLILLAGAMIGLLLLQWRFNSRTLLGLSAGRKLPRSTAVDQVTDVAVRIANPKRWLGAWLVVIEDELRCVAPRAQRLPEKGVAVIDEIRPRAASTACYQVAFHRRGRYRVGPTMISTRFPLGLGRGSRVIDNSGEILVHPARGLLTSQAESLFQQEMHGSARHSPQVGLHEAEFFGLRPWTTGDSRRWIHWRTTARLGELSVRQFERQQRRQLCVLLDLYQPRNGETEESQLACEKAISFLATLADSYAVRGGDRLAVAVAADSHFAMPSVQSAVLVEDLLDRLAVVSGSEQPPLDLALHGIALSLMSNPRLLVVSTREDQAANLRAQFRSAGKRSMSRLSFRWLNVAAGELEPYFSWS